MSDDAERIRQLLAENRALVDAVELLEGKLEQKAGEIYALSAIIESQSEGGVWREQATERMQENLELQNRVAQLEVENDQLEWMLTGLVRDVRGGYPAGLVRDVRGGYPAGPKRAVELTPPPPGPAPGMRRDADHPDDPSLEDTTYDHASEKNR